jgi:putative nucleotidyltransferase with HDIG domain
MSQQNQNILIIESEEGLRATLSSALSQRYKIYEASTAESAKKLLEEHDFHLIISEMFLSSEGVELLKWIKAKKSCPVIVMNTFSQIIETQKAHDLGTDDFISKPFSITEMLVKVSKVLKDDPESPNEIQSGSDRDFCRVPIEDYISEKELGHNIFIKLGENRYVKVLHRGGKIDPERVRSYKEKGVTYLYIRQEDYRQILGFTVKVAKLAADDIAGLITEEKKKHFLKFTGEMVVQNAFVVGVDKESLNSAKEFLESCMSVLVDDYDSFSLLQMLSDHTDFLYAHSLGVSAFSVMIGKQLGWRSPKTLFKLAFGGLFHDIGKKEISQTIIEKQRSLLTHDERKELETHVTRGKQILESMRNAPSEAIRIAYEHHEDLTGHGYPGRLRRRGIHPLTLVVSVANAFCEHTIRSHPSDTPVSGPEAILLMEQFGRAGLDVTAFKALKTLIKNQN